MIVSAPRARRAQDRGAVLPITALLLTVLITATAFTIDLGRMRAERRDLQAVADAIALDAVQATAGLYVADAYVAALAEANDSADRNGWTDPITDTEFSVGTWDVDTQIFTPADPTDPDCILVPEQHTDKCEVDAVEVVLTSFVPMYFDLSTEDREVTRRAVSVARAQAKARLGSLLSGVSSYDPLGSCVVNGSANAQMTMMNHLYTQYLGITVSGGIGVAADSGISTDPCAVTGPQDGLQLDALAWQGLAAGDVDLWDLAADMGFASPDELLDSSVSAKDLLESSATVMQASGDPDTVTAGTILGSFASSVDSSLAFTMGDTASGTVGDGKSAADAFVNALELVSLTAMAIDGNNFASIDLPANLPLVNSTIPTRISIIEPPQTDLRLKFTGEAGPQTAQVKIAMEVPLSSASLDFGALGGVLSVLGVQTTDGTLSIVAEVAAAEAVHDDIACGIDGLPSATDTLTVETGALTISVGSVTDAELQQADDVTVSASSVLTGSFSVGPVSLDLAARSSISETVTYAAEGTFAGGHDTNLSLLGSTESYIFDDLPAVATPPEEPTPYHRYDGGVSGTDAADTTYANLNFTLSASDLSALGVSQAKFNDLVYSAIQPATDRIDEDFLDPMLSALGITVAGADGQITAARCQAAALANRD